MAIQSRKWLRASGCLELVWPGWTGCWLDRATRSRLATVAARLPPIPRIGLELRLGSRMGPIDLHQLIASADDERAVLSAYLAAHPPMLGDSPAEGLHRLLSTWAAPDSHVAEVFPHLYLEHDLAVDEEGGANPRLLPCVFFDIHQRAATMRERTEREAAALDLLGRVFTDHRQDLPQPLRQVFSAIRGRGSIGHLGVMFSRGGIALRVNIKDLRHGALGPLLEDIAWPGDRPEAANRFDRLVDEVDRLTVAFDLRDGRWQPSIGFEAFIHGRPERDLRWRRLFDCLCAEALCSEEKRESLLNYPATLAPGPSGPPWPAPWVVATALMPRDQVPVLQRDLSHVKLSLHGDGRYEAKAYLSACHEWRQPSTGQTPPKRFARCLDDGIKAAMEFLLERCSQAGFWRDFHLDIGYSDEWVTAFVGCQLVSTGHPGGVTAARRGLDWLLRRQRPGSGWGYSAISPPDADSTAWALRLAAALGMETAGTLAAHAFLLTHVSADGGVATYGPATPILFRGNLLDAGRAAGWRAPHDCVTANAARLLGEPVTTALRRRQADSGAWRAHWWRTDLFATAMAVQALLASPRPGDQEAVGRAVAWARRQPSVGISAFDTACFLRMAGHTMPSGESARWAERLLDMQQRDGSWPGGAAMLFPLPWERERPAEAALHLDQDGVFTTAMALAALAGLTSNQSPRDNETENG